MKTLPWPSPDTPAVGFDEVASNSQPDSAAAAGARARFVHAVEALENVRQVLGGDADARVGDWDYFPQM